MGPPLLEVAAARILVLLALLVLLAALLGCTTPQRKPRDCAAECQRYESCHLDMERCLFLCVRNP